MIKTCPHCGKTFQTDYPTKIYCCKKCAKKAAHTRDESFYDFPHQSDAEPLFSFECAECGKTVHVYSFYDQRNRFCCGACAYKFNTRKRAISRSKQRYNHNLGMSGGMSLGSLIRREARTVDKDDGVEVKVCPICGKRFDASKRHPDAKYCSYECRAEAGRRSARKRYQKLKQNCRR